MRMKILWVLLLCSSSWWQAHAQSLDRQLISVQGQSSSKGTVQLEWSLGEWATSQLIFPGGMLTEGFHQGQLKVELVQDIQLPKKPSIQSEVLEVKVFPNPTTSHLTVSLAERDEGSAFLSLTYMDGRRFLQQKELLFGTNSEIDLTSYPSGMYVLQIQDKDGKLLKTFKITKTH